MKQLEHNAPPQDGSWLLVPLWRTHGGHAAFKPWHPKERGEPARRRLDAKLTARWLAEDYPAKVDERPTRSRPWHRRR